MNELKGDLISKASIGQFDVIVHGCNCFNTMGAGIAKQIRDQFPEAYEADCKTKKGDSSKLGTYTSVNIQGLNLITNEPHTFTIINAYTQYNHKLLPPPHANIDYDALRSVFKKIKQDFAGKRIGYPQIGAGLARGDWNKISIIIDEELDGEDHSVVIYQSE